MNNQHSVLGVALVFAGLIVLAMMPMPGQSVSLPQTQPASAQLGVGWLDPQPFTVMRRGISRMVFAGAWFDCMFIQSDFTYYPVGMGPVETANQQDKLDVERWNALTMADKQKVVEVCQ
jgi:hypothetical protein